MTARQRRIYWNRERNKAVKYINKYKGRFYRALQSDIKGFQDALQNSEQAARRYVNTLLFSDGISGTLNQLIREVGVKYARDNYNTLRKEKQFGSSEEWVQMIMDYLGTNFYNQGVLKIVQTSRGMMLDILERGNREGWGYYDYARYISETVPGLNQNRADMIARTEVGRAIHAGTFVGADKSPFQKQKMWVAAKDNRTRGNPFNGQKDNADHWHLDGQTVDFNDKFVDSRSGTELEHPHDPQAKAVDVIRCRCTFVVVNKRDANGRLIRKNTGMVLPISRPLNIPPPPQPQEVRTGFVPARTIKEAEEWAKNNIKIKVESYKGFNLETANEINKSLFDIQDKILDVPNITLKKGNIGKAYASYDWKTKTILVKTDYTKLTEQRANDDFLWNKQYRNDYHVNTSIDGLIKHEFGHAIDDFTKRAIYKQLENLPLDIKNELYGISGYASIDRFYATGGQTQGSEMVAEIISAKLTNSIKYQKLPIEAKTIINK